MLGKTPPWAMVTPARSLFSSSSFLRYQNIHQGNKMVNSPDGQLEVPWDNAGLLVVPSSITSKLKDLGGQVLHDSSHVDGSSSTHPLGIVSLPVREEFKG